LIFYDKKLDIENLDIELNFEKKLTKNDKPVLKFLFEHYKKNKEDNIEVEKNRLFDLIKISDGEIISFMDRFMKKKISYELKNREETVGNGSFFMLSSYFVKDQSVIFNLSREVLMSFIKDNFFYRINLNTVLSFENKNSIQIYLKFLNNYSDKGELEFSLDDFRKVLKIEESYDRFYDFERHILKPIISDLNKYSDYDVSYSKIKSGPSQSCKIKGLKINFINKYMKSLKDKTNELLSSVKNEVKNFDLVYKILFENLMSHEYSYVKNNLIFSKNNYQENFETFLLQSLKGNFYENQRDNKYNLVIDVKKKISTIYNLHQEVNKILSKLDSDNFLDFSILGSNFYKDLYRLKSGEKFFFKNEMFKIEVYYDPENSSDIKIWKHKK
jgi:plasmid replication initiation protein